MKVPNSVQKIFDKVNQTCQQIMNSAIFIECELNNDDQNQ